MSPVAPQEPGHEDPSRPEPLDRRAEAELEHDRKVERLLVWKGLAALLLVLLVAYVRHRYLL